MKIEPDYELLALQAAVLSKHFLELDEDSTEEQALMGVLHMVHAMLDDEGTDIVDLGQFTSDKIYDRLTS